MVFETAGDAKAEVEKLTADAKAETIEFKNTTVKAVDVICNETESKMRDVLVALNSTISNIIPKKEDGSIKEEFIPKIEILEPEAGKKGMRIKVSNWHPDAEEMPIFIFYKGKEWGEDLTSGPRYIGTEDLSKYSDGCLFYEYEWLDAGKEYVIGVAPLKKGEIGSGKEIKYAGATKDFTPNNGIGELSLLDANGKPCVATFDKNGIFHWVTKPAKYPGSSKSGLKFNYQLFTDGDNWFWIGAESLSLDGLTEEQAYADFTVNFSKYMLDKVVNNTVYAQVHLIEKVGEDDKLIGEPVKRTNDVTWTDSEFQNLK